MGRQQQPIGAPVWFELSSTDQDAATARSTRQACRRNSMDVVVRVAG